MWKVDFMNFITLATSIKFCNVVIENSVPLMRVCIELGLKLLSLDSQVKSLVEQRDAELAAAAAAAQRKEESSKKDSDQE